MNNMTRLLILLVAVVFAIPASAETLEVRGGVVNLAGAQTADLVWNAYNFGAFWYDLDDDLVTEEIRITANTLIGPNTDRTIDKNCLSYQISPAYQQYELHENEGLTVNGDTGYYIEGFMGEQYVAINNNADKLCEPLVEFEDDDKKTLAVGEAWNLGGGFALTAENLSCSCEAPSLCDSCTLSLSKNGMKLDEQIIYVNTTDDQDRVYVYAPNIGGEEHVPVFSCYVDAVFSGTDTDIVQLMYVFLIDNDVLEIDTGDEYGIMEVMTASKSQIVLINDEHILDLDEDSTENIMSNIYFKTADDDTAIRFYPCVIEEEPGNYEIHGHVVNLDSAQTADLVWNPYNFGAFWYDLDDNLMTEELRLVASTLDATYDRTIDEDHLSYRTSPVYQEYELYTNEGLTVDSDHPGGDTGYWIEGWIGERYVAIDGKADKLTKPLVEFDRYDVKTLNSGDTWDLGGGFVLKLMGINDAGNIATLQLFKNGVPLEGSLKCIDISTGVKQDRVYTYLKDVADEDNIPIFSCYVAAVFKEGSTSYVQLKYTFLIDDDVIKIETMDTYGVMEVMTASSSEVILINEDSIDLDEDSEEWIMGDMYFKTADDLHAIRFYPFAERTIPRIPETLTVDDSGGADYTSIQAAIDASESGDTVMVYNGTYHENVRVNKQLELIGIDMPVVDGGWNNSAIEVTADHCVIDGFRFIHGSSYGIRLYYSSNSTLQNNEMSDNIYNLDVSGWSLADYTHGIDTSNTVNGKPVYYLVGESGMVIDSSSNAGYVGIVNSSNVMVKDLTMENNCQGVLFAYTSNSKIENVNVSDNYYGIYMYQSPTNTLTNNTANSNTYSGIDLGGSSNYNILTSNTANSNTRCGIRLGGSSNYNILTSNTANSNTRCGIRLGGSSNYNILTSNTANSNDVEGIDLWDLSNYNVLTSNTANSNVYGIRLGFSSSNMLQNNTVNSNNYYGINLYNSSSNTLENNTANSNEMYGIFLWGSSDDNTLHHNNLIDNTNHNAYDSCTNTWDSGSAGNYYSDYTGTDNNTDGIGDTPYHIPCGTNIDRFPLMQPWGESTSQKGDLNGDGMITPADAAIALQLAASGGWDANADVNGDKQVTSLDALMILQAGTETLTL